MGFQHILSRSFSAYWITVVTKNELVTKMKFATDDWKISLCIFKVSTDSTTKPTELIIGTSTKLQLNF